MATLTDTTCDVPGCGHQLVQVLTIPRRWRQKRKVKLCHHHLDLAHKRSRQFAPRLKTRRPHSLELRALELVLEREETPGPSAPS